MRAFLLRVIGLLGLALVVSWQPTIACADDSEAAFVKL
jgi:hypothetical protein